jgi:RNase P subunit RPR2
VATAVEAISQSAQCSEAEAAESLLENLGKRYEESFMSVAKKQGLVVPVEKKWMLCK